jgi:hypothetical protein
MIGCHFPLHMCGLHCLTPQSFSAPVETRIEREHRPRCAAGIDAASLQFVEADARAQGAP